MILRKRFVIRRPPTRANLYIGFKRKAEHFLHYFFGGLNLCRKRLEESGDCNISRERIVEKTCGFIFHLAIRSGFQLGPS
jgi:hypothetical protein